MNYAILKTIIEASMKQYTCQNCSGKLDENSINIARVTDGSLDFLVICQKCSIEAHMHAEIGAAQMHTNNISVPGEKEDKQAIINIHAIKEIDIENIEKNLDKTKSIEDLLK